MVRCRVTYRLGGRLKSGVLYLKVCVQHLVVSYWLFFNDFCREKSLVAGMAHL